MRAALSTFLFCTVISASAQTTSEADYGEVNTKFGYTYCTNVLKRPDTSYVYQDSRGWLFGRSEFISQFPYEGVLPQLKRLTDALKLTDTRFAIVSSVPRPAIYGEYLPQSVIEQYKWNPPAVLNNAREFYAAMNRVGIYTPDLATAYEREKNKADLYFQRDHHWTVAGSKLAAQELKKLVGNDIKFSSQSKYEVTSTEDAQIDGSWASFVNTSCGTRIPVEKFTHNIIENSTLGLTDDEPNEIALVGTSNTFGPRKLDFDGFLEQEFGTGVTNYSVPGVFFDGMQNYFSSDEFHQNPAKLVVWEFKMIPLGAAAYLPNFRQIIPAVYGPCSGGKQLFAKTGQHDGETTFDFSSPLTSDSYLHLKVDDPSFLAFTVTSQIGTTTDLYKVNRSNTVPSSKNYYVDFNPKGSVSTISEIKITSDKKGVNFTATVCKY